MVFQIEDINDIQERFINNLSMIRRKKKISQKEINLAQKVVSRIENYQTDPRLSTIIRYLKNIGYDINEIFKEESVLKKPTKIMMEHLNLKLKEEGSCLRYVVKEKNLNLTTYELRIEDKYIDYSKFGMSINLDEKFEKMVREFFKEYGVEDTGFSNTVTLIFAVD